MPKQPDPPPVGLKHAVHDSAAECAAAAKNGLSPFVFYVSGFNDDVPRSPRYVTAPSEPAARKAIMDHLGITGRRMKLREQLDALKSREPEE